MAFEAAPALWVAATLCRLVFGQGGGEAPRRPLPFVRSYPLAESELPTSDTGSQFPGPRIQNRSARDDGPFKKNF
jgi:hypothetical protein